MFSSVAIWGREHEKPCSRQDFLSTAAYRAPAMKPSRHFWKTGCSIIPMPPVQEATIITMETEILMVASTTPAMIIGAIIRNQQEQAASQRNCIILSAMRLFLTFSYYVNRITVFPFLSFLSIMKTTKELVFCSTAFVRSCAGCSWIQKSHYMSLLGFLYTDFSRTSTL